MSQSAASRPSAPDRTATRRVLRSYAHYGEAEAVVDRLSDAKFPVEGVAIVARGLRFVETVTGRTTTLRAAMRGALGGALIGAFLGWFFGVFNWVDPLVSGLALALYGLVFGAVVGGLIGALGQAASGGRRDFSSVGRMEADAYDVTVDDDLADDAERVLAAMDVRASSSAD